MLQTKVVTVEHEPLVEVESRDDGFSDESLSRRHPLGVRPSGNALTSNHNLQTSMGLFGRIPDALVLLLFEYLDQDSLVNAGRTCRGLFAYSAYDQVWRDLALSDPPADFQWQGSWRASVRRLKSPHLPIVDCSHLFSDALHRPFLCSQLDLDAYALNIPSRNRIPRLTDLSPEVFDATWTNRPFILTQPVKQWPVYCQWSQDRLLQRFGETTFRAEAVDWQLNTYVKYMNDSVDESPLYLFDRQFVDKMDLVVGEGGDYQPPACFQEDLFAVLGSERPDHRWLIVGPKRSGSTFHKDPNATSAWNAVIRGSKYWIMFPQSIVPPGVFMSEDQSEVTSPLSIAEWLLTFHEEARQTSGCMEGICGEGEVLHVPSGWWHLVVNLEPATAVTQNFVPKAHLHSVVQFLQHKAGQVSGFKAGLLDPSSLFDTRLRQSYPDLIAALDLMPSRKRKWEDVIALEQKLSEAQPAFSFGFGDDVEEE